MTVPQEITRSIEVSSPPLPHFRYIKLPAKHSFVVINTHIVDPFEFYCQLEDNSREVEELMSKIIDFYEGKKCGVRVEKEQCVVGSAICCIFPEDGGFYRAEIKGLLPNGKLEVQLADYGNIIQVSMSDVRKLESDFLVLPAQALRFSLYGLKRYSLDLVQSPTMTNKLRDLISEKSLVAEVVESEDQKYSVVLRTSDAQPQVINNLLIDDNVEVPMPSLNNIEMLVITNYSSPQDFFGQLCHIPAEKLTVFEEQLIEFYSTQPPENLLPSPNQYVCAKFSENESFYRGQVLSVKGRMSEIFYIDYGNKELRPPEHIYSLSTKFCDMPQMGIQCGFQNVPKHLPLNKLSELMPDSTIEVELIGDSNKMFQVRLTNNPVNGEILKLFEPPKVKRYSPLPYKQPTINNGVLEQVVVLDVTSFEKFSIQLQKNLELLDEMMGSLDTYYKSLALKDKVYENPISGVPCVAKYSLDEGWYRAQILEPPTSQGKCNVYFVDYGNSEFVPLDDIKELQDEYAKLPTYAVQCALNKVAGTDTSPADLEKFKELVLNEVLTGVFSGQDPISKRYEIELIDSSDKSIGQRFLKPKILLKFPKVTQDDMWGDNDNEPSRDNYYSNKQSSKTTTSNNWNDRNSSQSQQDQERNNTFRSGNARDDRRGNQNRSGDERSKGRRRNSDRSDSYSSSDETKGKSPRSITKKTLEQIPVIVDYHYISLKLFSYVDIVVTHVVNPREFYGQVSESSSQLLPLLDEMSNVYGDGTSSDAISRMKPGDPCAALNPDDNLWYRGIVYNMLGHHIEVQLVDYGYVESVPLTNVKQLKPQFFKLPIQALKLSLPNVAPVDGRMWSEGVIKMFEERVMDKCIVAHILESKGRNIYSVSLIDADQIQNNYLDQELVSLGAVKLDSNQKPKLPIALAKEIKIDLLTVPIGTTSIVSVTWFKSYTEFYCQIESQLFMSLMEQIQAHYNGLSTLDGVIDRPLPNMHCVTQYSADNAWYRAQIVYSKRNKVGLFYIDYGNCEEVTRKYVKHMKDGLEKLPSQAIHCFLKGMESSDQKPSVEVIEKIYSGEVKCKFVSRVEEGYLVEVEVNGVNVADVLTSKGLVKSVISVPLVAYVPTQSEVRSPYPKIPLQLEEYEVISIYTESPQSFYCQQATASIQLDELMERIQLEYAENPSPALNISVGDACVAKYSEDQRWYRAVVTSITENEVTGVKFIDYGNQELVPKNMIAAIQPSFMELPEQAFECCLYGIPSEISESLSNQFFDIVDNKDIVINVRDLKGGVYLVSVLEKNVDPVVDIGISIFGEPVSYSDAQSSEVEHQSTDSVQAFPPISVPVGEHNVYVSHIESLDSFYVQLQSQEDILNAIVQELTNSGSRGAVIKNAQPGLACCAQYSEDQLWYRAIILSIENQKATVKFADYGNTDVCDVSSIMNLSENLVKIAPLAIECTLKGCKISPDSEKSFFDCFESLTTEKTLSAKFHTTQLPAQVDLFDEGMNLGEILIGNGVLVPLSKETVSVVANECPLKKDEKRICGVYVSHFNSINSFYVQLVSQTVILQSMMDWLAELKPEDERKLESVRPGTLCCAKFSEDGNWYRAVVLEVNGELATVRFIDYGNCDNSATCDLLETPSRLLSESALAIECSLNSLEAVPGCEEEASSKFLEIVGDKEVIGEFLTTDTVPVKIELIVEDKLISNLLTESGIVREIPTTDVSKQLTSENLSYPPWVFPSTTDNVPMVMSIAINLQKFYLQLSAMKDDLANLGALLHEFYTTTTANMSLEEIFVGMPCAALFSEDESWYRGVVKCMVDGIVTVFFVDYGNEETTTLDKLRKITPEFLSQPPYAIECQFNNLVPAKNEEEQAAIDSFNDMTYDVELLVKFLTLDKEPYNVEIKVGGEINTVAEKLILDGLAIIEAKKEPVSSEGPDFFTSPTIPVQNSAVYVSHVGSPGVFYLTLQQNENKVIILTEKLEEYCISNEATPVDSTNVIAGLACCCQYSEDAAWYRAQVLSVNGAEAAVKFVDFGNEDIVPISSILKIKQDLLHIPPYAFQCCLKGIDVSRDSEEAANLFYTFTKDKELNASFHSEKEPLVVTLYDGEIFPHNDIGTKLIRAGVATASESSTDATGNPDEAARIEGEIPRVEATLPDEGIDEIVDFRELAEDGNSVQDLAEKVDLPELAEDGNFSNFREVAEIETEKVNKQDLAEEVSFSKFTEVETLDEIEAKVEAEGISTEHQILENLPIREFVIVDEGLTDSAIDHSTPEKRYSEIEITLKKKVHAVVTHTISPAEFYLNLNSEINKLESLMSELASTYSSLKNNELALENVSQGQICVALYLGDLAWYRCKILNICDDNLVAFFVDYGNVENVNKCHVKEVKKEYLDLPMQAIKCSLHGIKVNNAEGKADQAIYDELVALFEKDGEPTVFLTEFVAKENDAYQVKLLDVGINVAEKLEEKGLVSLEREKQFPSVSSTDQVEEFALDSPIIRPPSREDKIVPGTIARGLLAVDEEIRNQLDEAAKLQKLGENKPVPGFVSFLHSEEVYSSNGDTFDDFNSSEIETEIINQEPERFESPLPQSRDEKLLPGLLSQGLMESESRQIELEEASNRTPKGRDEKLLPGNLIADFCSEDLPSSVQKETSKSQESNIDKIESLNGETKLGESQNILDEEKELFSQSNGTTDEKGDEGKSVVS